MADDPKHPEDEFASLNISSDGDEADWGEDWESAFQAEDDMFFSEGGEDDFFLDENARTPRNQNHKMANFCKKSREKL